MIFNINQRSGHQRNGVTVIEVLFAMAISLVGLVGILAIVPLAARQANESYLLSQATTMVLSDSEAMEVTQTIRPTKEHPWVFDEDDSVAQNSPLNTSTDPLRGVEAYKIVNSLQNLYQGLNAKAKRRINDTAVSDLTIARQSLGRGFCFDPLYYAAIRASTTAPNPPAYGGYVRAFNKASDKIQRNRFPFVSENYDISSAFVSTLETGYNGLATISPFADPNKQRSPGPQLIRVSAWSPTLSAPVTAAVANQIVADLGDTIRATSEADNSFGAIREFSGVDNQSVLAAAASRNLSWLATIVPVESNSDVIPTNFTLSIVVQNGRERYLELPDVKLPTSLTELPNFERVVMCKSATSSVTAYTPPTSIAELPISSGSVMTINMYGDNRAESGLQIGSYVMLSRTIRVTLNDSATNGPRFIYRNQWFRIIGLDDSPAWPRAVTLQGPTWNYPELPVGASADQCYEARTIATILPDVIAVYEHPITIQ